MLGLLTVYFSQVAIDLGLDLRLAYTSMIEPVGANNLRPHQFAVNELEVAAADRK